MGKLLLNVYFTVCFIFSNKNNLYNEIYIMYTKNAYNSTIKNIQLNNGQKHLNRRFIKEDIQIENRHTKCTQYHLSLKKCTLKQRRSTTIHLQNGGEKKKKKTLDSFNSCEDEHPELSHTDSWNAELYNCFGRQTGSFL